MAAKTARTELASGVVLTGTLAVVGVVYETARICDRVTFTLTWSKGGSATLLEVVIEGDLGGGNWHAAEPVYDAGASVSSGVASAASGYLKHTYDTGGTYPLHVEVGAFRSLRVKARETGTPGGTLSVAVGGVMS